jgi:small subunit ribosomal protein S20
MATHYSGSLGRDFLANSRFDNGGAGLRPAGAALRGGLPDRQKAYIIFVSRIFARGQTSSPRQEEEVMANTAQARKRARQAVKLNAHNSSQRSTLRTAIKAVRKAIEAGDKAAAAQVFQASVSIIDRIADKKIVHKNKAARHKSRLSAAIKALA